jgi:hypothetical protein
MKQLNDCGQIIWWPFLSGVCVWGGDWYLRLTGRRDLYEVFQSTGTQSEAHQGSLLECQGPQQTLHSQYVQGDSGSTPSVLWPEEAGTFDNNWHLLSTYHILGTVLFVIINFLLGYIHYTGDFIVTIPIRLILYIIYIAPIVSPPQPPPYPI